MSKKSRFLSVLSMLLISLAAESSVKLTMGFWRFELKTGNADIPFVIELGQARGEMTGTLLNGKEKIKLSGITLTGKKLLIPLQSYEAALELEYESGTVLKGHHVRLNKEPMIKTPVIGVHGFSRRYSGEQRKAEVSLDGRWEVTIENSIGEKSPGIVLFEQDRNNIHGSILTPTGDYRYFEGFVSKTHFEAASFDGVFNYLFKGELTGKTLTGAILSTSVSKLSGFSNPQATLPDAYAQTKLEALSFSFPDLEGKKVSLSDPAFENKAVIVQIFGSWCPNCMDEMNFLIPWYRKNAKRGVEVVALAFERSLSEAAALSQLRKLQRQKKVPYAILHAGSTAEDKPDLKLPAIRNFISFPTTIFLDRRHRVRKVHAGFTGPSTGTFYEDWKRSFEENVTELLK